jgi:homoserine dehydrogenase
MSLRPLRIAIIGLGIVGSGFLTLMHEKKERLSKDYALEFEIVAVCDKMKGSIFNKDGLDTGVLLSDGPSSDKLDGKRGLSSFEIIELDEVDVVVEATPTNLTNGGVGLQHARRALSAGKHFISTNKGAPALAHDELASLAREKNVYYGYEGTVLSGTPALSLATHGLPCSKFYSIRGILNGTTNFMLEKMEREEIKFDEALKMAQSLGYAESDPTGDIDGWDPCAKVVILANKVLRMNITPKDVELKGIRDITLAQIKAAGEENKRIKLVASLYYEDGKLRASVKPEWLDRKDPLYHIHGVTNAITYETDTTDTVTVIGPGAGGRSAGYAMLYDLLEMHRHRKAIY